MSNEDVRPWVKRLGSYLHIFGPPASGTMGYRTDNLDSLEVMAKEREGEFGRKRKAGDPTRVHHGNKGS